MTPIDYLPREVHVVIGITADGSPRRKVYLSSSKADECAAGWRRRGWHVERRRASLTLETTLRARDR